MYALLTLATVTGPQLRQLYTRHGLRRGRYRALRILDHTVEVARGSAHRLRQGESRLTGASFLFNGVAGNSDA